jgi:hypothetical protein
MQTTIVKLNEKRTIAVVSADDVEPILEHNKALRSMEQRGDFRHLGCVPNVIAVKWLNEEWQRGNHIRYLSKEWDALLAKKLRDPEWAYLRTDAPSHRVGYGS